VAVKSKAVATQNKAKANGQSKHVFHNYKTNIGNES